MKAQVTTAFRIREGDVTRKYTPGDVAEGEAAKFAVDNGYGTTLAEEADAKAKPAPANKAAAKPVNKASD